MAECVNIYTIGDYLKGKVRSVNIPDNALLSACAEVHLEPCTPYADVSEKNKELALAWLYVWVANGPTQTNGVKDSDADWSHQEGGERINADTLKRYLDMANDIFEKYDEPLVGAPQKWGFVGHGFCNPRRRR